jgi:hypothetical protein
VGGGGGWFSWGRRAIDEAQYSWSFKKEIEFRLPVLNFLSCERDFLALLPFFSKLQM